MTIQHMLLLSPLINTTREMLIHTTLVSSLRTMATMLPRERSWQSSEELILMVMPNYLTQSSLISLNLLRTEPLPSQEPQEATLRKELPQTSTSQDTVPH